MIKIVQSLVLAILAVAEGVDCGTFGQSAGISKSEIPFSTDSGLQSWNFSIAKGPQGETNAAIIHTADFDRSDPLLAGLMLRCAGQALDVIVVTLLPFPPKTHPQVILQNKNQVFSVEASVIPTGAGILLPISGDELAHGVWQESPELTVKIVDGETSIEGVITLSGLPSAASHLETQCSKK